MAIEIEVLLYTSLDYNNLGNLLRKYKPDRLGDISLISLSYTKKREPFSYIFIYIQQSLYHYLYVHY